MGLEYNGGAGGNSECVRKTLSAQDNEVGSP
jgi:hypothetical protein